MAAMIDRSTDTGDGQYHRPLPSPLPMPPSITRVSIVRRLMAMPARLCRETQYCLAETIGTVTKVERSGRDPDAARHRRGYRQAPYWGMAYSLDELTASTRVCTSSVAAERAQPSRSRAALATPRFTYDRHQPDAPNGRWAKTAVRSLVDATLSVDEDPIDGMINEISTGGRICRCRVRSERPWKSTAAAELMVRRAPTMPCGEYYGIRRGGDREYDGVNVTVAVSTASAGTRP